MENLRIMAPCLPAGEVRTTWSTDPQGNLSWDYGVIDNDSKEAECRCPYGACCVDGQNRVVLGTVISVGGVEKLILLSCTTG